MKLPHDIPMAAGAKERYEAKMRLMSVCQKITDAGWLVHQERLQQHIEEAERKIKKFTSTFLKGTGLRLQDLGPAGAGQTLKVKTHFFDTLKAPAVSFDKRTKRPQFNTPSLIEWGQTKGAEYAAPAAALLAIRKNRKLIDYCRTYLAFAREQNGRVHFQFNPVGTQTGRWTSSTKLRVVNRGPDGEVISRRTYSANAQQIPKRVPTFDFGEGDVPLVSSLRDCFLPDPGCVLFVADYDQLELRLIAYVYGVKRLIEALDVGQDIHMLTASVLFAERGIQAADSKHSSPEAARCRDAAKPCAYGISYQMHNPRGGRYPTLFKTLKASFPQMSERLVSILAERFFTLYPEIREGQTGVRKEVEVTGARVLPIDGRRLYYPSTMRGFNQALNFGMQGTGGVLADRAVIALDGCLDWESGEQIRAQVHDELVVQAPYESADRVAASLETAMSQQATFGAVTASIPAAADPGLDWGNCIAYNDFCEAHPGLITRRQVC